MSVLVRASARVFRTYPTCDASGKARRISQESRPALLSIKLALYKIYSIFVGMPNPACLQYHINRSRNYERRIEMHSDGVHTAYCDRQSSIMTACQNKLWDYSNRRLQISLIGLPALGAQISSIRQRHRYNPRRFLP